VGFIEGIASGISVSDYNQSGAAYHTFNRIYALTYWLIASFFGSILLGFSDHLRLLKKISKD